MGSLEDTLNRWAHMLYGIVYILKMYNSKPRVDQILGQNKAGIIWILTILGDGSLKSPKDFPLE